MGNAKPDSAETARLLEQAKGGDPSAFDQLFDRHRSDLRKFVELRLDQKLQSRLDSIRVS